VLILKEKKEKEKRGCQDIHNYVEQYTHILVYYLLLSSPKFTCSGSRMASGRQHDACCTG